MISSELQTFLSKVVSDDGTNGGRMSANLVISGQVQNVWPHVPKSERLSGSDKFRKLFDKVSNDDDESLINPGYYLDGDTLGEDWCVFAPTTQRSTQADWISSPPSRWYGAGTLKAVTVAGVTTSITVVMEDSTITDTIGIAADTIRISDKSDPDSVSGTEDILTVDGSAPVISGPEVTFTFTSAVANAYPIGAKVSAIYEPGADVVTGISAVGNTSAAGTFDDAAVVLDNIGTSEQDITLTFNSVTTFTVAADDATGLPSGSVVSEYTHLDPDFSKPMFTIPVVVWGGTFVSGDIVTFTTTPAAIPLVQNRIVPANAASLANNRIRKVTIGESET